MNEAYYEKNVREAFALLGTAEATVTPFNVHRQRRYHVHVGNKLVGHIYRDKSAGVNDARWIGYLRFQPEYHGAYYADSKDEMVTVLLQALGAAARFLAANQPTED